MTTGRINQVTIVRRGWPTDAREGAGEMSKLLVGAYERRAVQQCPRPRPVAPLTAIRFPPLSSPGLPSARTEPVKSGAA
jgi:hypothetical protein